MNRSTSIVAALAVLVVGGVIAWLVNAESTPIVDTPARTAAPRDVASAVNESTTPFATTAESAPIEPTRTAVAATDAETGKAARPLAIVRGRFVRPDGSPAAAATALLRGWGANQERIIKFGSPANWVHPTGSADADGNIEIAFDPPGAFQFILEVSLAGQAPVSWRWSKLEPASVTDLGTVTMPWGCVVEGDVVDAQGKPVPLLWSVHAESSFQTEGTGAYKTRVHAKLDAAHATFRIEGVPEGPAKIGSSSPQTGWLEDEEVDARRDQVTRVRFVYAGPDVTHAVTLMTHCERLHVFNEPDPANVVLTGHPSGPIDGANAKSGMQRLRWPDLPQSSYTIDIDDPRYVRWTKTGLKPGDSVTAKLVGSCSVGLTVIDPRTGAAIDAYRLRVRYRGVSFLPSEFVLRDAREAAPTGGLYVGIVPGDVALVVDADGFAATEFVFGPIEPRTTRAVTITLQGGATVRGTVVMSSPRIPAEGTTVRLRPPLKSGEVEDIFVVAATASSRFEAVTDARGAFTFTNVIPGTYELVATMNALVTALPLQLELKAGDVVDRELVLPAFGTLRGKLAWKSDVPPTMLRVAVREPPPGGVAPAGMWELFDTYGGRPKPVATTVASDGSFTLATVPAGLYEVVLSLPDVTIAIGDASSGTFGARWVIGSATIVAGQIVDATFDLGDRHPGFVRVSVSLDGSTAAGLGVRAIGPTGTKGATLRAAATLDERGEALLGPIVPGRYDLVVAPRDGSWFATFESSFALQPAETTAAAHAVVMQRGTIVLVDANGAALPGRMVSFRGDGVSSAVFASDAQGRIELAFPAFRGRIVETNVFGRSSLTSQLPTYAWPPANGELRVTLEE